MNSLGYNGYLEWQLNAEAIGDPDARRGSRLLTTINAAAAVALPVRLGGRHPRADRGDDHARDLLEPAAARAHGRVLGRPLQHQHHLGRHPQDARGARGLPANALGTFAQHADRQRDEPGDADLSQQHAERRPAGPRRTRTTRASCMELHTLGVDGGYTQQDVVEVARCFTGWRTYVNTGDFRSGTFYYDANRHDNNSKLVLGVPIAAGGGINDGLNVLRILANASEHPRASSRGSCCAGCSTTTRRRRSSPTSPASSRAPAATSRRSCAASCTTTTCSGRRRSSSVRSTTSSRRCAS